MRPRLPNSPAGLIATAFTGTLIACSIFLAPGALLHRGSLTIRLLIGLGLLAAGAALFLKSMSELKEGVRNQRWPEAHIAPLRRVCALPVYTAFSIVLLIAFAALALPSTHHRGLGWTFYALGQLLLQIRSAVVPPLTHPESALLSRDTLAPVHSDHWGQH